MKKLLILALLLAACIDEKSTVETLIYVKDRRTGICYAVNNLSAPGALLTAVPCERIPEYLLH